MLTLRLFVRLLTILLLSLPMHISTAQEIVIDQPIASHETNVRIYKITWHPGGQFLATATSDGVQIYDETLELVTQIHPTETVYAVSWSPNGSELAVTSGTHLEIWQWDTQSSSLSLNTTLQGEREQIAVEWSPGGTRIASLEMYLSFPDVNTTWDGTVHIWRTSPFESERTFTGRYSVEFSEALPITNRIIWSPNDDSMFAANWYAISDDPNPVVTRSSGIYFFNVDTGDLTRTIEFEAGYSTATAWHPSGEFFANGTDAGIVVLDSTTGDWVTSMGLWETLNVDWSPDGRYLAGDNSIYDFVNRQRLSLGSFQRTTSITAIDWHPNGEWLATADYDGLLRIEDTTLLTNSVVSASPTP